MRSFGAVSEDLPIADVPKKGDTGELVRFFPHPRSNLEEIRSCLT
jgi:hypothetical protein